MEQFEVLRRPQAFSGLYAAETIDLERNYQ